MVIILETNEVESNARDKELYHPLPFTTDSTVLLLTF